MKMNEEIDEGESEIFTKSETKEFEEFYKEKYSYICNLLKDFPRPNVNDEQDVLDERPVNEKEKKEALERLFPALKKEREPAKTVDELLERLAQLRGTPKPHKIKKKEKKELKKKQMREKRKKLMGNKVKPEAEVKPVKKPKPVYNSEGQMIFSKFDFSEMGAKKSDFKKVIKDPEVALRKVKEHEQKIKELKEAGEMDKVKELVEKTAVKTALLRSEGVKVKDDTELLKKSIKRIKSKKEKSAKKWEARENQVRKDKEERQKKRLANIQARAHQKKLGKLKKAAKKGKIVPGF